MTGPADRTLSRRNFLAGTARTAEARQSVRPPWSDEDSIQQQCCKCGDCISACPEDILVIDREGRPEVSFLAGECTFCGACAEACDEAVFDIHRARPWSVKVSITAGCLLKSGVTCQLCTDVCDAGALTFDMRVRPSGTIRIEEDACTGCGACISTCPVAAIAVRDDRLEKTA